MTVENCSSCKFWRAGRIYRGGARERVTSVSKDTMGSCRAHAPVSLQVRDSEGNGGAAHVYEGWPETRSDDYCGDWKMSFDSMLAEVTGKS